MNLLSSLPALLVCLVAGRSVPAQEPAADPVAGASAPVTASSQSAGDAAAAPASTEAPPSDRAVLAHQVNDMAMDLAEHELRSARIERLRAVYTERGDQEKLTQIAGLEKREDERFLQKLQTHREALPPAAFKETFSRMRPTADKPGTEAGKSGGANRGKQSRNDGQAGAPGKGGSKDKGRAREAAFDKKKGKRGGDSARKGAPGRSKHAGAKAKQGGKDKQAHANAKAKKGKGAAAKSAGRAKGGKHAKANRGGAGKGKKHAAKAAGRGGGKLAAAGRGKANPKASKKGGRSHDVARAGKSVRIQGALRRTGKGDLLVGARVGS